MQVFDYTEEGLVSSDVYDAIAKMRGHELAKVYDAIKQIKEEEQKQREEQLQEWFDSTFLPVLKDVAESVDAVLEITSDRFEIAARIKCDAGFELWVDRKRLRMALAMADAVAAENMGDELWFTLVYKKENLVK